MIMYCDLPQFGLIHFTGTEAGSFLQNQLTCDVNGLPPGRATYGAYCTPKGRALATFLLWRAAADQYYLQLPAAQREPTQKRLAMYVLRAKVKLEDAGPLWEMSGLCGAEAGPRVEAISGALARQERDVVAAAGVMAVRLPGERYLVLLSQAAQPETRRRLREDTQARPPAHWDWLDICAGIPFVGTATREAFVPQMLNLDLIGGLSYNKGCYPGQEIVARTHYLGRLKQRTYRIHLAEGEPRPGDKLYSAGLGDQACGSIVNAAPGSEGGFDALATMRIDAAASGTVCWNAPDGPAVEILTLPYAVTVDG
ncbi:MAG: folate-binding protein YgfZ [Burkholderiales bacterium]|nr:folate-binding protein YgfZ [Burkholderiales bacterium]